MEPIKAVSPTVSGTDKSGESYRKWNLLMKKLRFIRSFYFGKEIFMQQKRLSLYQIDMKYIRDLANKDENVMSVSPQINKENRPFVGIVVICDKQKYCIPLSSPKPKHNKMKNDVDFTKIYDKNKLLGVLNFNNMIPVDESVIKLFDLHIKSTDSPETAHYKKMAIKQLNWCQQNQNAIVIKANKLYNMVTLTPEKSRNITRRCCDFKKLEAILEKYIAHSSEHSVPKQNGTSTLFSRSAQKSFAEKAAKQPMQQQKDKSKDDITH